MIIDYSYFHGRLNLPQKTTAEGQADITAFIQQYEPEYLQCVLGYDLWKVFMSGLEESGEIEARWLNLLNGADYTYKNRNGHWLGFAPLTEGSTVSIDIDNIKALTVGGPGMYDPAAESSTITLPPNFVNVPFSIELRGAGTLEEGTEYTVLGNQVTVLAPSALAGGTKIFLKKGASIDVTVITALKLSPIANYVYYRYRENGASDTVLTGEVVSSTDNNRTVNAMEKMVNAWNRMVDMNNDLYRFLSANSADYPEWKKCHCDHRWLWDSRYRCDNCCDRCDGIFKKRNTFDI